MGAEILNALRRLPPGARSVLVLHDIIGYDHKEVAEINDCTMGNSKSQLHKARQKMQEWLA